MTSFDLFLYSDLVIVWFEQEEKKSVGWLREAKQLLMESERLWNIIHRASMASDDDNDDYFSAFVPLCN